MDILDIITIIFFLCGYLCCYFTWDLNVLYWPYLLWVSTWWIYYTIFWDKIKKSWKCFSLVILFTTFYQLTFGFLRINFESILSYLKCGFQGESPHLPFYNFHDNQNIGIDLFYQIKNQIIFVLILICFVGVNYINYFNTILITVHNITCYIFESMIKSYINIYLYSYY